MDLPLKACVLIVDDDVSIRLLLVALLRRQGYQMLEARNGREALAEMRSGKPDLVVMDLVMPEVSGWDVLRERAADPSLLRIPMIVVSASNTRKVLVDILDKHVCGVIAKPFDLDTVLTTVANCLKQPNLLALEAA
ncbi:MAG TPA: response regulator [Thermoanaerobaculia bacterium]|jgi:two-component system sensor histidine kinase/response regulator